MLIDEIKNIKSTKKELREFGLTIGIVCALIGGLLIWRGKENHLFFFIISGILLICGLACPVLLKPFQKVWMILAVLIGWLMTRVILCLLFYAIMTPTGLLARLFGGDILNLKFDKNTSSYWLPNESRSFDKADYEKQF